MGLLHIQSLSGPAAQFELRMSDQNSAKIHPGIHLHLDIKICIVSSHLHLLSAIIRPLYSDTDCTLIWTAIPPTPVGMNEAKIYFFSSGYLSTLIVKC